MHSKSVHLDDGGEGVKSTNSSSFVSKKRKKPLGLKKKKKKMDDDQQKISMTRGKALNNNNDTWNAIDVSKNMINKRDRKAVGDEEEKVSTSVVVVAGAEDEDEEGEDDDHDHDVCLRSLNRMSYGNIAPIGPPFPDLSPIRDADYVPMFFRFPPKKSWIEQLYFSP